MKVYNQRNWGESDQIILVVEVPKMIQKLNQSDLTMYLEDRYLKLAQKAPVGIGRFVEDLLRVPHPGNDPEEIVSAIMGSEQFQGVIEHMDYPGANNRSTQKELKELLDNTSLAVVVRYLSETPMNGDYFDSDN